MTGTAADAPRAGARLPRFAVLSGIGWLIDFAVFNMLALLGVRLFAANMAGAACGVMFVFVTARHMLFRGAVTRLHHATLLYIAWNVVAITAASFAVALLGSLLAALLTTGAATRALAALALAFDPRLLAAPLAKIGVTPFTMYANFVAMGVINDRRLSFL